MRPTLEHGDWLLADPDAYLAGPPAVGELVLVPDPRQPARLLVKRVDEVHDGGRELWVSGDAPRPRPTHGPSGRSPPRRSWAAPGSATGRPLGSAASAERYWLLGSGDWRGQRMRPNVCPARRWYMIPPARCAMSRTTMPSAKMK